MNASAGAKSARYGFPWARKAAFQGSLTATQRQHRSSTDLDSASHHVAQTFRTRARLAAARQELPFTTAAPTEQPTLAAMRRATWILWLMLALLPMRGWAVAAMGLPSAEPAAVHTMAGDAGRTALPPCHDAAEPGSDSDSGATGNCQACDWCHASLAVPPSATVAAVALPAAPPRLAAMRDTGRRLGGGLDRPPRNTLA